MRGVRFWLLILLGALLAPTLRAQEPSLQDGAFACGLNAAYIFLNRAGHHVAYAELVREFEAQQPPDSLLAIKRVLAKHGCRTTGIQADAGYFLDRSGPAIVYLQLTGESLNGENHFSYLVSASRSNGVKLLDPLFLTDGAAGISWDAFGRMYKGMALVVHE